MSQVRSPLSHTTGNSKEQLALLMISRVKTHLQTRQSGFMRPPEPP